MANARITQAVAETIWAAPVGNARLTQAVAEAIWAAPIGNARLTQFVVEVLWLADVATPASGGTHRPDMDTMVSSSQTVSPWLGL